MTRRSRRRVLVLGALLAAVLIVTAIVFGRRGLELVSWLAGIASFAVAVLTLFTSWPHGQSPTSDSPTAPPPGTDVGHTGDARVDRIEFSGPIYGPVQGSGTQYNEFHRDSP
jgi:hypothetical protein